MKIARREMSQNGADIVVAFIDTEGIDLGIDTIDVPYEPDEDVRPRLRRTMQVSDEEDQSGLDEDGEPIVDVAPVITDGGALNLNNVFFYINTFKKLTKNPPEVWNTLFRSVNLFLSQLSEEDARAVCLFYIDARRTIDLEMAGIQSLQIVQVATYLGNKFVDLAEKIQLQHKLLMFAKHGSGIPIPDLSYAGTRAGQDSEQYTFREPEYYSLIAISLACQLLCPIWGDLVARTVGKIDNMMKESYCLLVIEAFLRSPLFEAVSDKLAKYVENLVKKEMSRQFANAGFMATNGGFSLDRFYHIVFATILVKRYVNVDLCEPEGNLMIWTATCTKQSFNSLINTLNKRCRIMPRTDVSDGPDDDEQHSVSVLEWSSRVTQVTADVPTLIRFGARMAIRKLCREYNVSEQDFRLTVDYYRTHPLQVSVFNKTLVGILLGNRIGGAQGLKYLHILDFIELAAIAQIYIATNFGYESVVHLLSGATSDEGKSTSFGASNTTDIRIIQTTKESAEYRMCEDVWKYNIDNCGIPSVLRKIQDFVTKFDHFTNTAPIVSSLMDKNPVTKDQLIVYDEDVVRNFCSVMLDIVNREKMKTMEVAA